MQSSLLIRGIEREHKAHVKHTSPYLHAHHHNQRAFSTSISVSNLDANVPRNPRLEEEESHTIPSTLTHHTSPCNCKQGAIVVSHFAKSHAVLGIERRFRCHRATRVGCCKHKYTGGTAHLDRVHATACLPHRAAKTRRSHRKVRCLLHRVQQKPLRTVRERERGSAARAAQAPVA